VPGVGIRVSEYYLVIVRNGIELNPLVALLLKQPTDIPGLLPTIGYVDARVKTAKLQT
jgi:hypothetical protein